MKVKIFFSDTCCELEDTINKFLEVNDQLVIKDIRFCHKDDDSIWAIIMYRGEAKELAAI